MTKQTMEAKLNREDISGIGVEVKINNGDLIYYFYENFETETDGIDRAMSHLYTQLMMGKIAGVTFIEKRK